MVCCLNPRCPSPTNPESNKFCQSCGSPLVLRLRDRYRPIALLGQGGFGRSYLAIDEDRLQQKCVIKQFCPRLQETQAQDSSPHLEAKYVQLFEAEAQRLSDLGEHPQIPTLYAYFAEGDRLYLVQQFIEGQTLSQEVKQHGPFDEAKVRSLLTDLLPVLQFVHDRQVIHRDLKPDNILRSKDGKLFLIDFGVAKQLTGETATKGGTRVGTEGYAPLEQLRSGHAYPASDLYALGATCLFLLTGQTPDCLYDPLAGGWIWRNWVNPDRARLSAAIEQVIDRLLLDRVGDRYQSAIAVVEDLSANVNVIAPTIDPLSLNWCAGPVLTGHSDRVQAVAFSADGQWLASGSGDYSVRLWNCRSEALMARFDGHSGRVNTLAFAPDGELLFSGANDRQIIAWHLSSGQALFKLNNHADWLTALTISTDGRWLASVGDDGRANLWTLADRSLRLTLRAHRRKASAIALSTDGQWLATGGGSGTIRLWSTMDGSPISSTNQHVGRVSGLAFTPDGSALISSSEDSTIKVWPLTGGQLGTKPRLVLGEHTDAVFAIALSLDGQLLISGSEDETVKVWHLPTGQLLRTLKGHTWWVNSVAIAAKTNLIASGSGDKTIRLWPTSPT